MNSKIKEVITVVLIQLILSLPFYTTSVYGLTVSNVNVVKVTANSATISWNSDNAGNGKVKYGKNASLGFTQKHENFVTNHTLTVTSGIESDSTYLFAVESTDLNGTSATDNNSGVFYTFKTTDITPPSQVKGLKALSSTPTSILLSWDAVNATDLDHYVVQRNRIAIANTTANSFNDTQVEPNKEFNYKVSAIDKSGNEGSQSDTITTSTASADSIAPVISNIDLLPTSDTTAKVTWITDENTTSIVLFGINKTDQMKSDTDLETNHSVVIGGLLKNVRYTFVVKSCDKSNNCANSSNQSFTALADTTLSFINVSIPRFVNRRVIDIIGSTEPFTQVTLFVNDMNIPKRSLSSNEVGSSGKFIFRQVQLEQDNVIKIIAIDRSGNKKERSFEVGVDTQAPIVQLNETPEITPRTNFTISGAVNEPVTIKVFVDVNVNESIVPSEIKGLNATKIGKNAVELHWNESKEKDFSHYVVYRSDVGAIAITKPEDFNFFVDLLVDSGKSYTYQVSAVNIFGKESQLSEPITVTTLTGGEILNLKPNVVDIFEDFRKPLQITNASANFNFGIRLNKGDRIYKIKLIFEDKANNSVIIEKSVVLDTKKPQIKIISPARGALIFENTANQVDIIGKTEPNARVHLFIDRTPISAFNQSVEVTGIPPVLGDEIQDIPEAQLDAKCRFNVAGTSYCRTGADFSETADSEGNFKFKNVDLTTTFAGARIREVPPTQFREEILNREAQEAARSSKTVTLLVISTDQVGLRGFASQNVRLGTCWSGNQSWTIIPLTQYQSPALISTERLADGTETIYFYFNYTYIGRGKNARISRVDISKACGSRETLDPRFNISCQILPAGVPTRSLNPPENTLSYSSVTVNRFPAMDRFL